MRLPPLPPPLGSSWVYTPTQNQEQPYHATRSPSAAPNAGLRLLSLEKNKGEQVSVLVMR